ncbi:helix-turn-helix domain-containing protein [Gemmatimonadota bacterium]
MARSFETLRQSMSSERRQANEEVAEAVLAVMDLPELRAALDITQIELAARLEIAQSNVSRLEHRNDMLVSTLREVIRALGGELELVARFPDGAVRIQPFESGS